LETSNEAQGTADEKVTVAALIVMRIMKTFWTVTMNGVMVMMTCLRILLMKMWMIRGLPKGEEG
jgi:hypothetical protein